MSGISPDVFVLSQNANIPENIELALDDAFSWQSGTLNNFDAAGHIDADLYVICANPNSDDTFSDMKRAITACDAETVIVLPTHNSKSLDRASSLSPSDILIQPFNSSALREAARKLINRRVEQSWRDPKLGCGMALEASVACFENCFTSVQRGDPLPLDDVNKTCQLICQTSDVGLLSQWIGALDGHHSYSFRHSMFVCGSLTYFAKAIGIKGEDLQLLTIGGLLHDVGKSQIPLKILDKAGKLGPDEWAIMKIHPEHSREILFRENGLDPNIVAMAVHHHEKIDGSGYPDGLSSAAINDHVRLTAIADVYSALIDKRSYKDGMSNEGALSLMSSWEGHLDLELLNAFKTYVLDTQPAP